MLDGALQWPTVGFWRDLRRLDQAPDHCGDMLPDGVIVHCFDDSDGGMYAAIFTAPRCAGRELFPCSAPDFETERRTDSGRCLLLQFRFVSRPALC
jgi:hypothetical protein